MKKLITLSLMGILGLTSCDKDESKACTYYKKPLQVDVSFVGYYDYEINTVELYQYEKGSDFQKLVRKDMYNNMAQYPVTRDTSVVVFTLSNKTDYMVVLSQIEDTFKISDIDYEPEYFSVVEPSGKCNQTIEYYQLPSSANLDGNTTSVVKTSEKTASFYINRK